MREGRAREIKKLKGDMEFIRKAGNIEVIKKLKLRGEIE